MVARSARSSPPPRLLPPSPRLPLPPGAPPYLSHAPPAMVAKFARSPPLPSPSSSSARPSQFRPDLPPAPLRRWPIAGFGACRLALAVISEWGVDMYLLILQEIASLRRLLASSENRSMTRVCSFHLLGDGDRVSDHPSAPLLYPCPLSHTNACAPKKNAGPPFLHAQRLLLCASASPSPPPHHPPRPSAVTGASSPSPRRLLSLSAPPLPPLPTDGVH
ncbi:hypothetical protein U9M48_019009 [Paspalum notatum var. saurae]|uniref:Uncharacterized protein n=1 Tax=Paspalum notatum var. saurae TaxID=547442 RepID=A0AAQ3TAK7_PASNO